LLRVADVAAEQGGLLTTAQARAVGVSPQQIAKLARSGALEPVVHGVHRLTGTVQDRWVGLRAVWLALEPETVAGARLSREDPGGVVSHRSAAVVHGLGAVDADVHEFTVVARRRSRNPDVRFHAATGDRGSWTVLAGLPVTTVVRTIADLARVRTDGGHLARVVSDALVGLHVGLEEVAVVLRPFAHYYGAPLGGGSEVVERFLDEAGIPEATIALARAASHGSGGWPTIDPGVGEALARDLQRTLAQVAVVMGQVDLPALNEVLRSFQLSPAVTEARQHVLDTVARLSPQLAALQIPVGDGVGAELSQIVQDAVRALPPLPATLAPTPGVEAALRAQLMQAPPGEVAAAPAVGDHRGDDTEPS
jgi:hypothetical protein